MVFIKAEEGPPNYGGMNGPYTVHYFDEKGNMTIRSGGSKAWRNNNPGNMVYNQRGFAVRHGAIGKAAGMAVFPTEAIGRRALTDLLKSANYSSLTITALPEKYDKDNARKYRHMLLSISKLDPNKRIRDLTSGEFDRLQNAIERIEGWEVGREDFIEKWYITAVRKKSGVITEYSIRQKNEDVWMDKKEALQIACEGKLHVTIVHLKNGTTYLRPGQGCRSFTEVA